ncbi:hypothetical protein CFIMG_004668RA [Ceratocystis fimbriata CBS 114723]|uniref:Uncharacterized protein n=1 Tax=Ceratocystis fimbriata CBS 114723 TaxID=1035309 RepID=A0A2C5WY94_9PEZI|nr:hypothetical protein CFIMG_004668RA [Ceratocystis fimbriata CBS 114723]
MPDREVMNYPPYDQGPGHTMQFGGITLTPNTFQQPKVQGESDVSGLLPQDQGGVSVRSESDTPSMSMVPQPWRSPAQDHGSLMRGGRGSIGSANISWENEMEPHPQSAIINVPHFQSRICPFAHYNPIKYNRNEWAHCHNPQEKNGDIVVHLQRHHRLIRSQRKPDKTGRKNGNGQSYIAICSGENFNDRGDSQCHECESFEGIVESSNRGDDWNLRLHRISAICQKCWCILRNRTELATHLQTNCGGRSPKHLEKWQLELEAFCINPDWIEPPPHGATQSPMMTSPPPDLHSSMPSHAPINVPVRGNVGALTSGDNVSNSHGDTLARSHQTRIKPTSNEMAYSDTAMIESYKAEIEKLRLHLYFLVNHPRTAVSQSIQQMYHDSNCYSVDVTPPRKLDPRIEPPGIQWTPPYALITGPGMSSSAYMPMGPGPNNESGEYMGPPPTHPGH